MTSIGILIGPTGRGSNMLAIAKACQEGILKADVRAVVAPKPDLPASDRAFEAGLTVRVVPYFPDETYGQRLLEAFAECRVICLAGYLRLLPEVVLGAYPNRILNIHPALLPEFGGKGMYGMRVHEAVVAAGKKESGCTVHFVNERYDEGQILLQKRVDLELGETADSLAAKVLKQEHIAYVEALDRVITIIGS